MHGIRIVQTVATGGTAVLYKAVQVSLDRIVAVKRLHAHLTNDENFTRRFILEAKAAASLDHPNIVHVIDFGQEDGHYQMVMEFVEGESLKDVLERWRPIRYNLALAITHQILLGLEHAHARGIVHRDIKPGNIMLTSAGRVKIADFGLAKLTQASSSHTAENSILGTPLYMSPEQAFGESVDQRSDLFSLGTVLFEMITGRQPFASENYMGVIQNIINANVPTPRTIVSEIPPEIEAIVMRALSKDRDRRFQSAREFRTAIEDTFGIVRLNDTRQHIGALLDMDTSTQEIVRPTTAERSPATTSRLGGFAIAVFIVLAAGTAVAILRPDLLDTVRKRARTAPVQQAAISTMGASDVNVPIASLIRVDSSSTQADNAESRDIPLPSLETGAYMVVTPRAENNAAEAGNPAAKSAANSSDRASAASTGDSGPEGTLNTTHTGTSTPANESNNTGARPGPATETKATRHRRSKPAVREGFLKIHSDPTAEVFIDGSYRGDAQPTLHLVLPAGQHKLECRHPLHAPYRENLHIVAGELSRRNITLKKLRGAVSLATEAGAQLFVDGITFGTTPLRESIPLDAGKHTLALKKPGYHTWTSEITVDPGKTFQLTITLTRQY